MTMETILIHLLKSAGLLSIFYISYQLLLKNDTSFELNRKFLLGGIFAAAILPSLYFTKKILVETTTPVFYNISSNALNETSILHPQHNLNGWEIAGMIYLFVFLALLLRFIVQLYRTFTLIRSHKCLDMGKYKLIETGQDHGPFSFFHYIVFNPNLHSPGELELIFKHEKVHSVQFHTIDILISSLTCCTLWFNPLCWFYKKSIIQNLEFIADKETVAATALKNEYVKTLVKVSIGNQQPALTNSFYQSFIKKRIIMLNRKSRTQNNSWKLSLVLPAIFAFIFIFNVRTEFYAQDQPQKEIASKVEIFIDIDKNTSREKLEEYKKLLNEHHVILNFKEIQYNPEGLLTNIKVEFIDRSNVSSGNVTKSNAGGIEPFRYVYNNEEGSRFTTPNSHVSITQSTGNKSVLLRTSKISQEDSVKVKLHRITSSAGQAPIYIVNGRKVDVSSAEIDSDEANSMIVLKDFSAVSLYGKDAKDGAIFITTKNNGDSLNYTYSANRIIVSDSASGKTYRPSQVIVSNAKSINSASQKVFLTDSLFLAGEGKTKPLIVVDGKEMEKGYDSANLKQEHIRAVNVLKGAAAEEKYGEKGNDGVIEITTSKVKTFMLFEKGTYEVVTASSSDKDLKEAKKRIKQTTGIDVDFDKIKRKSGVITGISISAQHKGQHITYTASDTQAINDVYIGLVDNKIRITTQP